MSLKSDETLSLIGVRVSKSPSSTIPVVLKPPSKVTLKKYGFGTRSTGLWEGQSPEDDWLAMLAMQGNVCPICKKAPTTGRWVTDHEHVRGWKDMPPSERRKYVRGITCWFCNSTYLGRAMSHLKAVHMVAYFESYELRRDGSGTQERST